MTETDALLDFRRELESFRLGIRGPAVPDGEFHRVPDLDKPRDKDAGWYILTKTGDGALFGHFGSWIDGRKGEWNSIGDTTTLSKAEREHLKAAREAAANILADKHKHAAERASNLWDEFANAPDNHPYLLKKAIKSHGTRLTEDGRLVIPIFIEERLSSLQYINEAEKRFLKGGKTKAGYFAIGEVTPVIDVGEGFATMATAHECTGNMSYVAFYANNLDSVVAFVIERHPHALVRLLGDDDVFTPGNPGRTKAEAVARKHGITVTFPEFTKLEAQPTDFNDMLRLEGADAVRTLLEAKSVDSLSAVHLKMSGAPAFPPHCLDIDGPMGRLLEWIDRNAPVPQPRLTLAAGLATLGTLFGRRYCSPPYGTYTNILIMGLAETGGGKDHARKCFKALMSAAELDHMLSGGGWTSGSAVISSLQRWPAQVGYIDEFGLLLKELTGRNASSHQQSVLKTIMELYSTAGSKYLAQEYSTLTLKKEQIPERADVENPSLSVYGTSTQAMFYEALNSGDVASGYLNRWLVFEGDADARLTIDSFCSTTDTRPPPELVDWIKRACPATSVEPIDPSEMITTLKFSFTAERVLREVVEYQEERRTNGADAARAIWARFFESVVKIASIRAICDNLEDPVIEGHHAEWAKDLVEWCLSNTSYMTKSQMADTNREKWVKKIWGFIHESGGAGRDKQHVTRKFQNIDKRTRQEILDELLEIGALEESVVKRANAKRPAHVYVSNRPPA